jgi:RNA polymerase sigma-70 factor, ECF subfamily
MTTRDDIEDLIAKVSLGDHKAFAALYDATSAKLFGVCIRILDNRAEAEETLQEAFVRIWQKSGSYSVNGYSPMTWLIALTRNLAIDKLRSRTGRTVDVDKVYDLSDEKPGPEAQAIAASERAQIDACMNELGEDKAGAVKGAYLEGYSYQELATRYDVPLNTMRTWLRRSLIKLKECLTQ